MRYTAPGHQHIELLVPRPTTAAARKPAAPSGPDAPAATGKPRTPKPRGMEPLLHQAIDAAFGGRNPAAPMARSFVPAVRAHIRAQQRERKNAPAGQVSVVTCHAREGGEYFGTVDAAGKRRAFVARVDGGKLVSFRVL